MESMTRSKDHYKHVLKTFNKLTDEQRQFIREFIEYVKEGSMTSDDFEEYFSGLFSQLNKIQQYDIRAVVYYCIEEEDVTK